MWSWVRGEPLDVGVLDGVAVEDELGQGGVEVAGVPQHDGIEDEAKRTELVFLAFAVALAQLAALTVEDLAGESMAGFDAVELGEDAPPVGLVVEVGKQVEGLGDPAEFGDGTARWGWAGRLLAGRGGSGRALWDAGCAPSGRRMSRAGARRSDCVQPDPTDAGPFCHCDASRCGRRTSAWPSSSCVCRAAP